VLDADETERSHIFSKNIEAGMRPFGFNRIKQIGIAYDEKGPSGLELSRASKIMTKGEQTRRKIVEAAAPIFNRRGYEGSSLNDLMQATGLKKGGIYRHFSSKEELAAEAFDYTWEAAWNARLLHVEEKANGIEKLKQLIANFVDHRSPVAGGCPILNTAVDADDGNPILRARVAKALRSWLSRLETIVKQATKRDETRAGVDPKVVATLVVASLEGALMMSRLERNDEPLRRVQQHLNRYLDREVAAGMVD
jgi:TetR/AcrR family transcriptional regulator, transcriptional repressor for nem operon